MYRVKVTKQNKATVILCGLLAAGGVGLFALSFGNVPFPALAQLGAVCMLAGAIYLYSVYLLRDYTYAIEYSGIFDATGAELYDLVVVEEVGRKQRVVCRLSMQQIEQVVLYDKTDKSQKKPALAPTQQGAAFFRYHNDLFATKLIVVYCTSGDGVALAFDQVLYDILRSK